MAGRPLLRRGIATFAEGQQSQAAVPQRLSDVAPALAHGTKLCAPVGHFGGVTWYGLLADEEISVDVLYRFRCC